MNIFNKVLVVIILIFFVLISLLAIVNEFIDLFDWSDVAARLFNPATDINPYISTLALLMVITLCVFLLLLEFYRRRLKIAKVYNVESGRAMITINTVIHQIRETVLAISGVKGMKATVVSKNNGVILNMLVELSDKVSIPEKMDEIISSSVDVCKNKLNINVLDTKLTITNLVPEKPKEPAVSEERPGNKKQVNEVSEEKTVGQREIFEEEPKTDVIEQVEEETEEEIKEE